MALTVSTTAGHDGPQPLQSSPTRAYLAKRDPDDAGTASGNEHLISACLKLGLSLHLNPVNGHLLWSNEGQRAAAGFQNPTVRRMTAAGVYVRDFAVPGRYQPAGSVAGNVAGDRGIANHLAFEGLTLSTATENALVQDGPAADVGRDRPLAPWPSIWAAAQPLPSTSILWRPWCWHRPRRSSSPPTAW